MTLKTCFAIRHVECKHLGSYQAVLSSFGYTIYYLDPKIDDLEVTKKADLLVFCGGPMAVYEDQKYPYIKNEIRIAEQRLRANKPMLGICLGAQIISKAAGAKVYKGSNGHECGWHPIKLISEEDNILKPITEKENYVMHWHSDTFDLPAGAKLLASSNNYTNQAYAIGSNVLGLQFHGEFMLSQLKSWLKFHKPQIQNLKDLSEHKLKLDSRQYAGLLQLGAVKFSSNWLKAL